ncbi:putative porin [Psychrosphaera ytuae]|uniref:Porin n=1 Tax=Psychrosphaera ytuae TaxID=2820710 RepID=A0A975DD00_9GAMM|nr:putative porin [Psychrosphaera ytuae]QTH63385.1 putative porin [Psychrosphaera ytuae]
MRLSMLFLMLASVSATANEYQSITHLSHTDLDEELGGGKSTSLQTVYYFDKKKTLGPLNEFAFINTVNNVSAGFDDFEHGTSFNVGGEVFFDQWRVAGSYTNSEADFSDGSNTMVSIGYFFQPNLLIGLEHSRSEYSYDGYRIDDVFFPGGSDSESTTYLTLKYEHDLNGNDYIGVMVEAESDFDQVFASTKYFSHLGDEQYLSVGVSISDHKDFKPFVALDGTYYFNQRTSLHAQVAQDTDSDLTSTSIGGKLFINDNWAVAAGYRSNEVERFDGSQVYVKNANAVTLNVTAQY